MDHLILTAGLNELPVLVAAHRLCRIHWDERKDLPKISVLCSESRKDELGSEEEAGRVRSSLVAKLVAEGLMRDERDSRFRWTPILVDPYRPIGILEKVTELIRSDPGRTRSGYRFHLHYTGGTAAMGLHALEALTVERTLEDSRYEYDTSYLNAKEYTLVFGREMLYGKVLDERKSWNLTVNDLAKLHGFRVISATTPDDTSIRVGHLMLNILKDRRHYTLFGGWLRGTWEKQWENNVSIDWPVLDHPDWNELTGAIQGHFSQDSRWLSPVGAAWRIDLWRLSKPEKKRLAAFLHHQCLELFAYDALQTALKELSALEHVNLAQGVECHQPGRRKFEMDVLAVFGYETLLVSCSLSIDERVKQKAFEALHRARQIGGTQARAIVVCADTDSEAQSAEIGLEDDIGGRGQGRSVKIWGRSTIDGPRELVDRFKHYILDMKWGGTA